MDESKEDDIHASLAADQQEHSMLIAEVAGFQRVHLMVAQMKEPSSNIPLKDTFVLNLDENKQVETRCIDCFDYDSEETLPE